MSAVYMAAFAKYLDIDAVSLVSPEIRALQFEESRIGTDDEFAISNMSESKSREFHGIQFTHPANPNVAKISVHEINTV